MFKVLLSALLVLLALCVLAVLLVLEDQPLVSARAQVSPAELIQLADWLRRNDPRQFAPGQTGEFKLSQSELNLLLNEFAARVPFAAALVDLKPGGAIVSATLTLPSAAPSRFVNLRAVLVQTGPRLAVTEVRIGGLTLPPALTSGLLDQADRLCHLDQDCGALRDSIRAYRITDTELTAVYRWNPDLVRKIGGRGRALIPRDEQERLSLYAGKLAEILAGFEGPSAVNPSLAELMAPLFAFARERTAQGQDPVAENQALIRVLGLSTNGVSRAVLDPVQGLELSARLPGEFRLRGRFDLVQHFLVSALLAVSGGQQLADAAGLLKELDDSRGGSGFSFTDLAADRAGVRFAELATASPSQAQRVQELFRANGAEDLFMPRVSDLPEFLSAREFQRRFGDTEDPRYQALVSRIETRIAALPLYNH